jgi:predicted small metal-binding protein
MVPRQAPAPHPEAGRSASRIRLAHPAATRPTPALGASPNESRAVRQFGAKAIVPVAVAAERGDATGAAGSRLLVPLIGGSPVLGFDVGDGRRRDRTGRRIRPRALSRIGEARDESAFVGLSGAHSVARHEKGTLMKTMTCKQLGGPCEFELRGNTADEVIKAQDQHLKDMVAGDDEAHEPAMKEMKGRWKRPLSGIGWYRKAKRDFAALPDD